MIIAAQLIAFLFLLYIILLLLYSMLRGAPYAPLGSERIRAMAKLLEVKKGVKLADLGSGDGRIVIYFSKLGVNSTGFEINPLIYILSIRKIRKSRSNAKVILQDYWKEDLSKFEYITIYGAPNMMKSLEKKLMSELKQGSKVVSNHFKFPYWKHEKKLNDVYLYIKS